MTESEIASPNNSKINPEEPPALNSTKINPEEPSAQAPAPSNNNRSLENVIKNTTTFTKESYNTLMGNINKVTDTTRKKSLKTTLLQKRLELNGVTSASLNNANLNMNYNSLLTKHQGSTASN